MFASRRLSPRASRYLKCDPHRHRSKPTMRPLVRSEGSPRQSLITYNLCLVKEVSVLLYTIYSCHTYTHDMNCILYILYTVHKGMSRSGTRGGKPSNVASNDMGLSGMVTNTSTAPPNLDSYIEKCDGSEEATQAILGDLITKPKLTQKLLSKPPFRFLHDIIMEVIRTTSFASGLYTDIESDSSLVTEKQQKMDFLDKIIRLVGIQLNTIVEAKPTKIVSGLDSQATNNFLQLLAVAARHLPQSENAVKMVLAASGTGTGTGSATASPRVNNDTPPVVVVDRTAAVTQDATPVVIRGQQVTSDVFAV